MKKYGIGIDIGATWIRGIIGNRKGEFLKRKVEKTKKMGKSGKVVTEQVLNLISSLIEGIDIKDIEGIGIASIGPLNLKNGAIVKPANLPFNYIPLVKPVRKKFELPVYLLNDASAGALGEKIYGVGKNVRNLVYITLSTGIGGGAIVDGKLLFGKDGNAAEIGHMVIAEEKKLKCGCGKYSHWEAFCGGNNIPKFVKLFLKERKVEHPWQRKKVTTENVFEAAKKGDKIALEIVEEIGKLNAMGVANVINVYDPSLIIIGGAIALNNEELVLGSIKKYVKDFTINRLPEIKITPLREDVGLYGALAIVFNKEFYHKY